MNIYSSLSLICQLQKNYNTLLYIKSCTFMFLTYHLFCNYLFLVI